MHAELRWVVFTLHSVTRRNRVIAVVRRQGINVSNEGPLNRDDLWMMEEYKALRAEILANEDYQKSLLIFGSSVLAAAFGFIYRDVVPADYRCVLLLLTQILAIGFWYAFERLSVSTEEIGTYIACYLEKDTALNWETFQRVRIEVPAKNATSHASPSRGLGEPRRAAKDEHKKSARRRFFDCCSQLPFLIFTIVSLVLIVVEAYKKWEFQNTIPALLSAFIFAAMILAFLFHEFSLKSTAKLVDMTEERLTASLNHRETNTLHLPIKRTAKLASSENDATNKAVNPSGGSGVS